MKKVLFFLAFQSFACIGFSQIANNDFEEWNTTSINQDSASNWSSTNQAVHNVTSMITTMTKTNGAYSNNYAVQLNLTGFGFVQTPVIGILVNGEAKLDFNASNTSYVSGGGSPLSFDPTAVKGYYYISGGYPGYLEVLLSKYDTVNHQRDTVGLTTYTMAVTSTAAYVPFNVPLTYSMTGVSPDSITMVFYAAKPSSVPSMNCGFSSLFLDSVGVIGPTIDGQVARISSPSPGTTGHTAQTVKAWIKNLGNVDIANFDISYTVNDSDKVTGTFMGTIVPNDSAEYTFLQTFTPDTSGNMNLCVFLEGIASDIDTLNDTTCISFTSDLSVNENQLGKNISLYPNPASDYIMVETSSPTYLELYDVKGQLIYSAEVDRSIKVNTSEFAKGIYICRFYDQKGVPVSQQKIAILH